MPETSPISTFIYTGPNSAMTLRVADARGELIDQDVVLWSGRPVDLPADHELVMSMQHQGLLVPVTPSATLAAEPAAPVEAIAMAKSTRAAK